MSAKVKKSKKARLGRVGICLTYVVDLNDPDMVQEAKDCLYEDIMFRLNELHKLINVKEDKTAKRKDIPDFLREQD